jgi:ABC-type bacteriocin/lantibiotic exporter with double-glycine peptidase domain
MPVPHFQQSSDGACLPACARMVLAAYGDERSEAELARLLGTEDFGTRARNITRLERLGYRVTYGTLSVADLQDALRIGRHVIAFVQAGFLSWPGFDGLHAMVVVEFLSEEVVAIHDPSEATGPRQVALNEFLLAWEEFDNMGAVL